MGKKDQNQKDKERVQAVLELLKKQAHLSVKQVCSIIIIVHFHFVCM